MLYNNKKSIKMERTEPERTAQQIINSAVPLELTPISRVDMSKLTPVSVNVHTEEDTGSDLMDAQYINIHRVPETLVTKGLVTSTLSGDILSHHVVDLGGPTDFGQHAVSSQYYDTDDLLTQDLNEDDRRLAAALVAVQLVHQQKQQQQQHPTVLTTDLLGTKPISTQLAPVTPVNLNKPEMTEMVGLTNCYIQTVEDPAAQQQQLLEGHQTQDERIMKLYHQPPTSQQEIKLQPLPPLKKVLSSQSMGIRNKYDRPSLEENKAIAQQISVIQEDITSSNKPDVTNIEEELDSDCDVETKSSCRSLPHKKRIPKKLKAPPARNIHAKCYKCNKCGESFTSQAGFSAHRTTHSVPAKRLPAMSSFSCELCNKLFSTQIKFFEHLKSHYEPLQPLPLPSLETQASNVIALQNVNPQPSIQNSFTLKTEDLGSHIKEEVISSSTLPCPQCGKLFRRQKALETHVSVAHPSQEDIEEFSEPEDMMEGIRHVVNIQGTDSGEEDHCDDKMSRQWRYGEVQEMGMDLQEMCLGLTTNNDSDSEKTKNRRNKQLSCTICSRAFNHRNSLLYHVRSHSGQRPHQCEVCGKSFFASSALKVHMRLHSGDKPYKCEFCGRHFRQWGDLKYHVTSLHSDQKQFQCEYCGKDFARKYSLIVHRRIHTGEKNYHCEFCNKTFRASSYLQNHRRIHTGEKPHPCDVCGKPFRVRSDMKRHRNTHTGERGTRRTVSSAEALSEGEEEVAQQVTEPETIIPDATPLNLNIRSSDSDDGLSYARGEAIGRDGNTLFVWIPTQNGTLLTDE